MLLTPSVLEAQDVIHALTQFLINLSLLLSGSNFCIMSLVLAIVTNVAGGPGAGYDYRRRRCPLEQRWRGGFEDRTRLRVCAIALLETGGSFKYGGRGELIVQATIRVRGFVAAAKTLHNECGVRVCAVRVENVTRMRDLRRSCSYLYVSFCV